MFFPSRIGQNPLRWWCAARVLEGLILISTEVDSWAKKGSLTSFECGHFLVTSWDLTRVGSKDA